VDRSEGGGRELPPRSGKGGRTAYCSREKSRRRSSEYTLAKRGEKGHLEAKGEFRSGRPKKKTRDREESPVREKKGEQT